MKMHSYKMTELGKELSFDTQEFPELTDSEVLVKVAGCGVCHTDLSFWHSGVKTKHPLPLTLGHEISGTVVMGSKEWMNKNVIIPAVLPCGECDLCKRGKSNICQNQKMPGNDFDGGFASHIKIPSKYLCEVSDSVLKKFPLEHLAVIADAVSTPYQVVKKSELEKDDLAIIIGVGGIGIYAAQIARVFGGKVLAMDIDEIKLNAIKELGFENVLNIKGLDIKEIKTKVKELAKNIGASPYCWKIFEMSGTKPGQELAFNLMTFASSVSIVGFTLDKLEVRLSNLMAFDSKLIGTWGCRPELYPEVLELVADEKILIEPFIQTFPLSEINQVFRNTLEHKYSKRSILLPDNN
ncbi:MAG: 6-hydroxycyclohex-1-ene-1-carbonyl-CoA dehydrogenase [Ignavibacteria bacterium]